MVVLPYLRKLLFGYTVEYINNIKAARERLWHNSYDVLLLEERLSKKYTLDLSKMAYAMSRPTIIFCSNRLKYYSYLIWKFLSKFTKKHKTSRKLIYCLQNYNKYTSDKISKVTKLNTSALLKDVTAEIFA